MVAYISKWIVILFAAFLLLPTLSTASVPGPSWGAGWRADVYPLHCELIRHYRVPYPSERNRRGFLSGSGYHKAIIRFMANTRTHGDIITSDQIGVISFSLLVYPYRYPVDENDKIVTAKIDKYVVPPTVLDHSDIHMFTLSKEASLNLLQKFVDNEMVDFSLQLASGEGKPFKVYPSGNRTFNVLEKMFKTCINESVEYWSE